MNITSNPLAQRIVARVILQVLLAAVAFIVMVGSAFAQTDPYGKGDPMRGTAIEHAQAKHDHPVKPRALAHAARSSWS